MPLWLQGSCSQVSFILLQKLEEPSCPFELSGHSQPSLAAANGTPELWAPGHRADNGCGASPPQGSLCLPKALLSAKAAQHLLGFTPHALGLRAKMTPGVFWGHCRGLLWQLRALEGLS